MFKWMRDRQADQRDAALQKVKNTAYKAKCFEIAQQCALKNNTGLMVAADLLHREAYYAFAAILKTIPENCNKTFLTDKMQYHESRAVYWAHLWVNADNWNYQTTAQWLGGCTDNPTPNKVEDLPDPRNSPWGVSSSQIRKTQMSYPDW